MCNLNVNTLEFVLRPLCLVCVLVVMVSVVKIGCMHCFCGMNENVLDFTLTPLFLILHCPNFVYDKSSHGITHKIRLYALPSLETESRYKWT